MTMQTRTLYSTPIATVEDDFGYLTHISATEGHEFIPPFVSVDAIINESERATMYYSKEQVIELIAALQAAIKQTEDTTP